MYPNPGLVIVKLVTIPLLILAVAVALPEVPTPTGKPIATSGAVMYPAPPAVVVAIPVTGSVKTIDVIVPAAETIAVAAAAQTESCDTISIVFKILPDAFS